MIGSTVNVQGNDHFFSALHCPSLVRRLSSSSSGFAYIALIVTLVIIGISLSAAGKYWSNVMLRDREEELIFRGEQYRKAIDQYSGYISSRKQYPPSIDDLLKDPRSPTLKRYLRQKYKDPMTGEDFDVIKDPTKGNRIVGVRSKSDKECLKQVNFPPNVLVPISAGTYSIPLPFVLSKSSDPTVFSLDKEGLSSDTASVASDKIKYSDWLFIASGLIMGQNIITRGTHT